MKKMLAMLIAGVMVLGTTFGAAAEEAETETSEVIELTYDMIDETVYEGAWLSFNGGYDLYLPADWDILEIAEEDAEAGVVFQAMAPDGSGMNMVIVETDIGTEKTIEDVYTELAEAYEGVEKGIINGINCVSFETDETTGIAFLDVNGIMYSIQIGPKGEETAPYAQNIFVSMSPTETEAETEAE